MWRLKQFYAVAYFPIAGTMWLLGALGWLPRVKPSTQGEGHERRYFYGSVWAVAIGQPVLWMLWKLLPATRVADAVKLVVFIGIPPEGNASFLNRAPHALRLELWIGPQPQPAAPGDRRGQRHDRQ